MTAEHRVSILGSRLHRYEDPERSHDPRVRAVVSQLRTVEFPTPRADFRDELRTQLVAVAPRLVADGAAETAAKRARAAARARTQEKRERRRIPLGRPLAVVATLVVVCALVLGGAVWMSKKALPGDTLYGLKRTSEGVQLSFASNDAERAADYLRFSQNRVAEARALLGRASAAGTGTNAGGVSASQAKLLTSTLGSADSQLKQGWTILVKQAVNSGSAGPLSAMTRWGPGQIQRLHDLSAAMPDGALRSRANASKNFTGAALTRARALQKTGTSCSKYAPTDAFGPVPSTACSTRTKTPTRTARPGRTSTHVTRPSHRSAPAPSPSPRTASRGATRKRTAGSRKPSAAPSSKPSASKTKKGLLPPLPIKLPAAKAPLISSCGISLPLGINLGSCSKQP